MAHTTLNIIGLEYHLFLVPTVVQGAWSRQHVFVLKLVTVLPNFNQVANMFPILPNFFGSRPICYIYDDDARDYQKL